MATVRNKTEILDSKALWAELKPLCRADVRDLLTLHRPTLPVIRRAYHAGGEVIRARFFEKPDGIANAGETSYLIDRIIRLLVRMACECLPAAGTVSVVAVGGYGRGTLSPCSDIDILFLHDDKDEDAANRLAQFMLYVLWDLKLKVGHAIRTVEDSIEQARGDTVIQTSLLDARFVAGNDARFALFQKNFEKIRRHREAEFIRAKLEEREERHKQMGDSRYFLEPNIKEGKGGLRDLQTLWWIAKYAYRLEKTEELARRHILTQEEYRVFIEAWEFIFQLRAFMHYVAGRAEEVLTFHLQQQISQQLGYRDRIGSRGVEQFMKHYFVTAIHVGNLTRTICTVLEVEKATRSAFSIPAFLWRKRKLDGFALQGKRLDFADPHEPAENPVRMLEIFRTSQKHGLDIHPAALRAIHANLGRVDGKVRKDRHANAVFMEILTGTSPRALTLRRMSEAGVLGRFVKDFGRVMGQMQFDMYHVFTVDEHTIYAVSLLSAIEQGELAEELPLATRLMPQIEMKRALYVAVFLHDIAKGRGGNHSVLGEEIAHKLCPRLGLSKLETDTVAWLVRHHLLMSHTAFKRDLADPQTVSQFVREVQSLERLKMLLVLTAADIRAVGPHIWNGWKGALLRELYTRAANAMGGASAEEDAAQQSQAVTAKLRAAMQGWDEAAREAYLTQQQPSFWLNFDLEKHEKLAELAHRATKVQPPFDYLFTDDAFHAVTELAICTANQHGLFARLAGACTAARTSIVNAKIFSLPQGLSFFLLDLQTEDGKPLRDKRKRQRVIDGIRQALAASHDLRFDFPEDTRRRKLEAFRVEPSVLISNMASDRYTLIEISARDRLGLLHAITRRLAELGLAIHTAHISTYGEKAVDVFYVQDVFGMKVEDAAKIDHIRASLEEVLADIAPADVKHAATI